MSTKYQPQVNSVLVPLVFILISFFTLALAPASVSAQSTGNGANGPSSGNGANGPSSGNGANGPSSGGGSRTIQNPLQVQSISQFISALLKAVIAIGVPIAILFIVLAGFKFVAAQGSPDKLSEARTNFMYVIIGIAIFIGASALAEIIMATLRQIGVNV